MPKAIGAWLVNSKGERFYLESESLGIIEIDGIFSPNYTVHRSPKASGDGSRVTGKQAADRDILISSVSRNTVDIDKKRRDATRFLTLHDTYKIYIQYNGVTRWAECELIEKSCAQAHPWSRLHITVMLYCAYPRFRSVDGFGKDVASRMPMFTFPYVSTVDEGFITGYYLFQNVADIDNIGDCPSESLTITFTAWGDLKNPSIVKNGTETMKIIATMVAGDAIVVDFLNGQVRKNGNRYTNIDPHSVFFELDHGLNTLVAHADENEGNLHTHIEAYSEFEGL